MKKLLLAVVLTLGACASDTGIVEETGQEVSEEGVGVATEALCGGLDADYARLQAFRTYRISHGCTNINGNTLTGCGPTGAKFSLVLWNLQYHNGTTVTYEVKKDLPPPQQDILHWSLETCGCGQMNNPPVQSSCTFVPN